MKIIPIEKENSRGTDSSTGILPFESFYRQYYGQVYGYIRNKIGKHEDAEDLATEVFMYCYEHYDTYDPGRSKRSTWLYLIVNSRLKNYYRDKKEFVDFSTLENYLLDEADTMGKAVYLEQLRTFLANALLQLNEKQRKAIVMRYFQNREYSEIAREIGTTPGNARVVLSRALDKLGEICNRAEYL